jgi:hypothetical protein
LSRAVKTILEQDAKVSAVYALAEGPDGSVYAGTGPHGILLRVKDDKVTRVYESDETANIFSIVVDAKGQLLLGTGGEAGKILRIADPNAREAKAEEVFAEKDVQYVWAVKQTPDGNLYAATGPNGQLFEIKPDGSKSVLLDSDENNLLSLVSDGKDLLYVGTDPNGLVYRVNRKNKEVFVLFDAPESEVGALALDAKGNLYAATAEASETPQPAVPGAPGAAEKSGRPEGTGGVPIPGAQPPENPKPPPVPDPNPGEPNPIPKKAAPARERAGAPVIPAHSYLLVDEWARILKLDDPTNPGDDPNNPNPPQPPAPGPNPNPGKRPGPGKPAPVNAANPNPNPQPEPIDFGKPKPEGNAIYKIDTDGFVREIFRQPVMVLSMIERNGVLLVGTGSDGNVYQVDPAAEETVVLAKVDPKQVLSMLATKDGKILLGMANVGGLATMSSGFASEGTFASPVLDATQISRFGKLHLEGSLPKGASLTIATRSGNVQDPEKTGWSNWSDEANATSFYQIPSPSARFLQYRLTFTSEQGKDSAVVDQVDVAYQMPNLAPVIKSVKVGGGGDKLANALTAGLEGMNGAAPGNTPAVPKPAQPKNTVETINWEAEDANGDALQYALYFRTGSKAPWILLKDKLTETTYQWDTRTVADGRYEIKVVASDAAANPPGQGRTGSRVSDPMLVDNTSPLIGDLTHKEQGSNVALAASIADRTSTVASLEYSVDSGADWQAVLPSDNIFDSPEEKVQFTVSNLSPGAHQITLRATDAKGNHGYETVFVNIEAQAGK